MSAGLHVKYSEWSLLSSGVGILEEMEDFHILLYTLLYCFKFIDGIGYLCNLCVPKKKRQKKLTAMSCFQRVSKLATSSEVIQAVPPTSAGNSATIALPRRIQFPLHILQDSIWCQGSFNLFFMQSEMLGNSLSILSPDLPACLWYPSFGPT